MKTRWTDWNLTGDYREDWLRQAEKDRLARIASDNPDTYVPADVAWLVNGIRAIGRWLASGLGNPRPAATKPPYQLGKQQKHGA
jgi:hypothetical protein